MTRLKRRRAPGLWSPILALIGVILAATPPAAQTSRTQERDVFVSVLNQADEPVTGLEAREFIVRENGLVREVLRVRRATDAIDLAILVDNSQAAGDAMLDLRRGLEAFVDRMKDHAHVAVITVADRPTIAQDYTNDGGLLKKTAGRLFAIQGSGATVLEGLSETIKGLRTREAERAAVLTIWLGGQEFSNVGYQDVLKDIRDGGATVYAITVGGGAPADANTTEGRNREIVFDQGTRDSGGRRRNVLSPMGLTDALQKLAHALTSQYRITYARPDSLIPPETFEVSVRTAGLTARGTAARVAKKGPARP